MTGTKATNCQLKTNNDSIPKGEPMTSEERYNAYMVRIWQDGSTWRAQVTHVDSRERRFFTSLGQLCLFWQEETAVASAPASQQGDDVK